MSNENEKLNMLLQILPVTLKQQIIQICLAEGSSITEIRLRQNMPCAVCFGSKVRFTDIVAESTLLETVVDRLCSSSFHSVNDLLAAGSFSYAGCRVGVAGHCVYTASGAQLTKLSSLCIRIAAEHRGIGLQLTQANDGHLLIAGPPASGKTSLLRDYVRLCASAPRYENICVIDSRAEIAGLQSEFDLGCCCDVLSEYSKPHGIEVALRSLSPQAICCDEIASAEEVKALELAANAGIRCLFSAHLTDADAMKASQLYAFVTQRDNVWVAFLSGRNHPGTVVSIVRGDTLR